MAPAFAVLTQITCVPSGHRLEPLTEPNLRIMLQIGWDAVLYRARICLSTNSGHQCRRGSLCTGKSATRRHRDVGWATFPNGGLLRNLCCVPATVVDRRHRAPGPHDHCRGNWNPRRCLCPGHHPDGAGAYPSHPHPPDQPLCLADRQPYRGGRPPCCCLPTSTGVAAGLDCDCGGVRLRWIGRRRTNLAPHPARPPAAAGRKAHARGCGCVGGFRYPRGGGSSRGGCCCRRRCGGGGGSCHGGCRRRPPRVPRRCSGAEAGGLQQQCWQQGQGRGRAGQQPHALALGDAEHPHHRCHWDAAPLLLLVLLLLPAPPDCHPAPAAGGPAARTGTGAADGRRSG